MTPETQENLKKAALAAFLQIDATDIEQSAMDDNFFECDGAEYLVLTGQEAYTACLADIKDSLWAFNASFILSKCGLPLELEDALTAFQAKKCEYANDALLALVEKCTTLTQFSDAAIRADGRGHFLASYDGAESESPAFTIDGEYVERGFFFIYRTN